MTENKITDGSEYGDYVICNNCEKEMLVDIGEETCPCCGKVGSMQWALEPREYSIKEIGG